MTGDNSVDVGSNEWFIATIDKADRKEPATAAEMLAYENSCSGSPPIAENLTIELRSVQEIMALAEPLKEAMRQAALAFPESVAQHASSGAWFDAIAYRLIESMLGELRVIFERATGNPGSNL